MSLPWERRDVTWRPRGTCDLSRSGFQVGAGAQGPRQSPPAGGGAATFITDIAWRNDGGSTASGQLLRRTFGFTQGQVPTGQLLEFRKSDGTTPLTYQSFDAEADRYADGSLKFIVGTVIQEDNANSGSNLTYKLYRAGTSTANNVSPITNANLQALAITVDITAGGTTYTFDVAAAITAARIRDFALGPWGRTVQVWGVAANGGTPNNALYINVDLTLMRDGTTWNAWVEVISNWDQNYSVRNCPGTGTITAMRLKQSGSDVRALTSLSFNNSGGVGTDIPTSDGFEVWNTNACTMRPLYDPHQLSLCRLIPYYPNGAGYITALGSPSPLTFTPMDIYDLTAALNTGGGRFDIGYQPGWHAAAAVSQAGSAGKAWSNRALLNALGASGLTKNFYNSTYGLPLVVRNQTYGSIVGNNAIGYIGSNTFGFSGGTSPFSQDTDTYHWPFMPWWMYVVWGQPWWLRKSIVDANQGVLGTDPSLRARTMTNGDSYTTVTRTDGGPRGWAWSTRNILDTRMVIPSTHPLHDYIVDVANDNLNWFNSANKTANIVTAMRALNVIGDFIENPNPPNAGISTRWFMHGYTTTVLGMQLKRGYLTTASQSITGYVELNTMGMGVDGCNSRAQGFTVNFSIDNSLTTSAANTAQTWDRVAANADTAPTWDDSTKLIPSTGCPASGTNSPYGIEPWDYFGVWRSASACCADGGSTKSGTYYTYMQAQLVGGAAWTDADLTTAPHWIIERE